jgi:hypothetical protein
MKRTILTIILTMFATLVLGGLVFQRWQRRVEEAEHFDHVHAAQAWERAAQLCLSAQARDAGASR